jgi:hypothetical protein
MSIPLTGWLQTRTSAARGIRSSITEYMCNVSPLHDYRRETRRRSVARSTKSCAIRSCLLFALLLAFSRPASAQRQAVWGVVTDSSGKPVIGAAIKLSNRVTLKIRSFITQADGKYRFRRLHPDMDYTVRTQKDGYRTKTRRLSHFKISTVVQADLRKVPETRSCADSQPGPKRRSLMNFAKSIPSVGQRLPTPRESRCRTESAGKLYPVSSDPEHRRTERRLRTRESRLKLRLLPPARDVEMMILRHPLNSTDLQFVTNTIR